MSDNSAIQTRDERAVKEQQNPEYKEPVVSGPGEGEVKDIDAVDDDHPLVAETGDAALETQTESGAGEFLSDFIYEHDSAWVREWLQNEETACVRAAKLLVRLSDDYPDDWLTQEKWVDAETGETIKEAEQSQSVLAEHSDTEAKNLRRIEVSRPIEEVLEAARTLGYDPTIVWDVYLDERKIVTEDNGIGMTPYEFDKAFNTIFNSGSGVDGETGGMFGVGSESSALVHGNDGGAEVETRSRRPTKDGEGYDGFRAYSYLGGANALPGEVEEGFKGTRFDIPVQDSFSLTKLQDWVETYTQKLRVPLLYREHDAGSTPVEEEYEATVFTDDYGDVPVMVHRPGEFSVVGGPDVLPSTAYSEPDPEDTFLVSMPIERNTRISINTFWDVVIQIHDEQGLIVSGPHRGLYRDEVDELHDDDVVLPEPTGDRDRLQKDSKSKEFFEYVEEVVKSEEMQEIAEIANEMKAADHPADVITGSPSKWQLFNKMVNHYGSYHVTDSKQRLGTFLDNRDELPDFTDTEKRQIYMLFKTVSHCNRGPGMSSKKSRRRSIKLGKLLANNSPEKVYMAASTGGNFTDKFKVLRNTVTSAEVIVVKGSGKYDKWNRLFGFQVLKELPVKQSDDHDFNVPDAVHENQIRTTTKDTGKSDDILDRELKIRTDDDNSSIDCRWSIERMQSQLESDKRIKGHQKLVLFTNSRDTENISDHYDMAKYAAIASVSKTEYDKLADYDDVMTYEEFTKWSKSTLIATEDGAMTPDELIDDDRMVILAYRHRPNEKTVVQLLSDDNEELRSHYCEDIRDQNKWARILDGFDGGYAGDDVGQVPDIAKDDTLFAVAGPKVVKRAEWAFDQHYIHDREMVGLRLRGDRYARKRPIKWRRLDKSTTRYKLMVDTPNWDNNSDIYDMISNRESFKAQMYLGLHDRGIDPSKYDAEELRDLIGGDN